MSCKRNRGGPVRNAPPPRLCGCGAGGSSAGPGPAPLPWGCSRDRRPRLPWHRRRGRGGSGEGTWPGEEKISIPNAHTQRGSGQGSIPHRRVGNAERPRRRFLSRGARNFVLLYEKTATDRERHARLRLCYVTSQMAYYYPVH